VFERKCVLVDAHSCSGPRPDIPSEFVEVRFSLPCDKQPEWLNRKSPLRKFRLRRDQDADSVLKEFMDCGPEPPSGGAREPCLHVAMWKHVPGAEPATLPFGQRVPSYLSVDLPLAPSALTAPFEAIAVNWEARFGQRRNPRLDSSRPELRSADSRRRLSPHKDLVNRL
jgi:hypothetical protein